MNYAKQPLDYHQIISQLKSRWFLFHNEDVAISQLQIISYFRIANYLKSFEVVGFSRKGGKRDDAYNVRLGGKDVHGAVVKSRDYVKHAKFVIMYDFNKQITRLYTFRVKNTGEMSKEKMIETGYENPRHDRYFCYFFDEEITLGKFDIESIIETEKTKPGYVEGMPIYLTGKELIKFRK